MYTLILIFTIASGGNNGIAITTQKIDGFKSKEFCEQAAKDSSNLGKSFSKDYDLAGGNRDRLVIGMNHSCVLVK